MKFRADLHCHTTCSDGSFSPEELVHLAINEGLNGLSITDHDTTKAYDLILPLARSLKLPIISGIEFSTSLLGTSVHVLGYAFSLNHEAIHQLCQRHTERRNDRNRAILEKLSKHNIQISEEDLIENSLSATEKKRHTIGRPHIANAMIKKGYVQTIQEAFRKYLAEDACCYVPGMQITTEETIEVIHEAKGLAVIAHPHLILSSRTIKRLLDLNFDGIESYYAKLHPSQEKKWIDIANKKGWIITGGSDFHGNIKPHIPLGCSWTPEETFKQLYQKCKLNNNWPD